MFSQSDPTRAFQSAVKARKWDKAQSAAEGGADVNANVDSGTTGCPLLLLAMAYGCPPPLLEFLVREKGGGSIINVFTRFN